MSSFVADSQIVDVVADSDFESLVKQYKGLLLFFWASWHEPSIRGGQMDILFQSLSSKYAGVKFVRIEAEKFSDLSLRFKISVVPTFLSIADGMVTGKVEGVDPPAVAALIKKLSSEAAMASEVGLINLV